MWAELGAGSPRAESYWAQQIALGPVLFHALAQRLRARPLEEQEREALCRAVGLALRVLGALPDDAGLDPARLAILARRQATALASGRRRQLVRMARRLGLDVSDARFAPVPGRLLRAFPLIGWRPPSPSPEPDPAPHGAARRSR